MMSHAFRRMSSATFTLFAYLEGKKKDIKVCGTEKLKHFHCPDESDSFTFTFNYIESEIVVIPFIF